MENWLEIIANELVYIRQTLKQSNEDVMPWRLQIAAQLLASYVVKYGALDAMQPEASGFCLKLADALIKAHEETK